MSLKNRSSDLERRSRGNGENPGCRRWGRAGRASPVDDEDASRVEASPAAVISTPRSVASSSAGRFAARPAQKHPPPRLDRWRSISSGVRGDPIVRPALRRKHAARNHGGKHVPHIHAPDANARRGGHAPPPARRRVCVTTRDATVENHRDGQSAKTDDVDDRRRTTGASMMDDAFQPCTRRLVPRRAGVVRVRTSPRVPSPPSPSLSPLPRVHSTMSSSSNTSLGSYSSLHLARPAAVASPLPATTTRPDPLGHPREMPRRSKRPRRRAALLHP